MEESPFVYLSNIYGKNQYEIDGFLKLTAKYFGEDFSGLSALGSFAGNELYEIADYVDKVANPRLITWSIDGKRVDRTWIDPSERWALNKLMTEFRINSSPYTEGDWMKHFASLYLVSDPGIACVLTVTNQTAYALFKYGTADLKKYISNLTGQDGKVMFGATWFTEIQGGSDLGNNLVTASGDGENWYLDGDTKYFSSDAGLADLAVVTARIPGGARGAKGLGLFLVPEINSHGEKNFTVRRLKRKSGTMSVPTGEVEFLHSECRLLGRPEEGIYYTMENLMVSRLSNAMGALGIARKSYLEAYFYLQKRQAFGKVLIAQPLIRRDLMDMEVYIEGSMLLAFKAAREFQRSFMQTPPYTDEYHYARMLAHMAKNITADMASYVSEMAMQLHGGLGFLKEFPVERLHREALITPIWEGPSNIQAIDFLEVIQKKRSDLTLTKDIEKMREDVTEGYDLLENALLLIRKNLDLLSSMSPEMAQFYAKDMLNIIGHSFAVILLVHMSNVTKTSRTLKVAALYARRFLLHSPPDVSDMDAADEILPIDRIKT
ncbi:MAG: acyl-CoA dehydrogenase family protein [Thermoplasmataceae archaeon]|jgi:alkylation response protein AidB-like acyl-CoA dehydrogenase